MARLRPPLLAESRIVLNAPFSTPNATSLLKDLCTFAQEVGSCERPKLCQQRNISNIVRRIKLLIPLFEEMQEVGPSLPPTAIVALRELYICIQKSKLLLNDCQRASLIWLLMGAESVSGQFHELTQEIAFALGSLPLDLLEISIEVKEQVELLRLQAKRSKLFIDPLEENLRAEVLAMLGKLEMEQVPSTVDMQNFFQKLQIKGHRNLQREQLHLEKELENQIACNNILAIETLKNLISLVRYFKCISYGVTTESTEADSLNDEKPEAGDLASQGSDYNIPANVPDEYKCPISLELMRDPVIIATGQSYDRHSIQRWIDSGHSTCPKTGQKLTHLSLVRNYALKSLISRWCEEHKIAYGSSGKYSTKLNAVDDLVRTKAATEATKLTAAFLVGKLAAGSPEVQKKVANELRLLAKCGMDNRRLVAEAGAIPFLLPLLWSADPKTQEDGVTALLNLSICDGNRKLIMEAGSLNAIVHVLQNGKSIDARENAAATIFSLSVEDEYKVIIGSRQEIIAALVGLLRDGSLRGKKDSCIALFNLAVNHDNRRRIATAGTIPKLVNLLEEDSGELAEEVLGLLALLATVKDGLIAIGKNNVLLLLNTVLRMGSAKAKENSAAVLVALCRHENNNDVVLQRLLRMPSIVPSLYNLLTLGSPRARRKASSLLKLLHNISAKAR
ncbi:hypothetical protein O6H91_08G010800 [Diphasiastrum complanatum]|uniref:Uncharacterized protein n=2 Tax=Diphasiastrum complanatum TaxID=34168 RepID=A0ACC2CUZ3_DIPCM|nr:hypothetical protein O6H91_08G010800 [Diphasiastrum complanatum]KAJ7545797.1 hypothetical protein O6H91_08G010800 [Diphasiastrum complanatum]